MTPLYSVIIPFQTPSEYLQQTLDMLGHQSETSFEVILLPDEKTDKKLFGDRSYPLKVVHTGAVSPAIKRDIGADVSSGDYLAFLDDDAYPEPDWLQYINDVFREQDVAAVAGPQLTPVEDGFWQQVSGAVFLSSINGDTAYRYWPKTHTFDVDDWPSVNLCVRKEDFFRAGKFDSSYWPGEDTILCLGLVHTLGKRIVCQPQAIVRHHRRSGLGKHLRQVGGYGLHRGHFARKFPRTSCRPAYFAPSILALFFLLGWILLFMGSTLKALFLIGWTTYACALLVSLGSVQARTGSWGIAAWAQPYILLTHLWYGMMFIRGFISKDVSLHGLGR